MSVLNGADTDALSRQARTADRGRPMIFGTRFNAKKAGDERPAPDAGHVLAEAEMITYHAPRVEQWDDAPLCCLRDPSRAPRGAATGWRLRKGSPERRRIALGRPFFGRRALSRLVPTD